VTYGDSAHTLLVPVSSSEGGLLAAIPGDAAGLTRSTLDTIAADRLTDFTFADVRLAPEWIVSGDAAAALRAAQVAGVMALCAESVGLAAALVDITAARVRSRHAFGAPLSALPTVQLRAGDLYLDLTAARAMTRELASAIGHESDDLALLAAATKITVTAAAARIVAGAHQLCGGWGQLEESGLHRDTRALKALEGQLGGPALHRRELGRLLIE
jgi:alkylation response protein AidB-like acyl-CoA dehydrogenase